MTYFPLIFFGCLPRVFLLVDGVFEGPNVLASPGTWPVLFELFAGAGSTIDSSSSSSSSSRDPGVDAITETARVPEVVSPGTCRLVTTGGPVSVGGLLSSEVVAFLSVGSALITGAVTSGDDWDGAGPDGLADVTGVGRVRRGRGGAEGDPVGEADGGVPARGAGATAWGGVISRSVSGRP